MLNVEFAGVPGFENGVDRIVDDVQEDLLDLMRIGDHQCRFGRHVTLDVNVVDLQIVVAQSASVSSSTLRISTSSRCGVRWRANDSRFCTTRCVRCACLNSLLT